MGIIALLPIRPEMEVGRVAILRSVRQTEEQRSGEIERNEGREGIQTRSPHRLSRRPVLVRAGGSGIVTRRAFRGAERTHLLI